MSWNGVHSDAFPVSRGVQQGGCNFSHSVHCVDIDDLLYELEQSVIGCFWDDLFVGALAYDLTLLAPSPAALRRLLYICEGTNMLKFNPAIKPYSALLVTSQCAEKIVSARLHTGSSLAERVGQGEVSGVTGRVLCTWWLLGLAFKRP